jgi:4-amino-4-deoxy-L-arabinose transferase-like glycosyltransferase
LGIALIATGLRLWGYRAGLPSLNDPDEPLFVVIALKMLSGHGLNPGWFGHPGTLTFYSLALIFLAILYFGIVTGQFADLHAFATYVYGDPSILFSGGRLLMAIFGVLCVLLTARIGRRLFGQRVGLAAAALLAINPLHINYSQIIRTDIQATVFILLCVIASIDIARSGRLKHYLLCGVFMGMACATKWPSAIFILCPLAACLVTAKHDQATAKRQLLYLLATCATALISLVAISPYLLLDYPTLMSNMRGELQVHHLGATGGGFFENLWWYFSGPMTKSVGLLGLIIALVGMICCFANRLAALLLIPATLMLLIVVGAQTLVWDRWILPLLPILSLFMALGAQRIWEYAKARVGWGSALATAMVMASALVVPMLLAVQANVTERTHDTRNLAAAWVHRNVPAGSTVLLEHLGFDLLSGPWRILIPAGDEGCIDARQELAGKLQYSTIHRWRGNRAILDFGTVGERNLDKCYFDVAVFSHYDRYKAEQSFFLDETRRYEHAMANGTTVRVFRPIVGKIGGPVVRIIAASGAGDRALR